MGADIHVYMEYKNDKGEWKYTYIENQNGDIVDWYSRNYKLFALLAEVRGISDCPYTIANRGLPTDVSNSVKSIYEHEKEDLHSTTWYSMTELQLISEWVKNYKHEIKDKFDILNVRHTISLRDINELNEELEEVSLMQLAIDGFIDFCNLIADVNFKLYKECRVIIWFDN